MLRRMRPDMLLIEEHTGDDVLPALYDLEYPWHRRNCRVHVVEKDMSSIKLCWLEQMVGTRRKLEHDLNQGTQCRPLANKRKNRI